MTDIGYDRVSPLKAKGRKEQHVENQADRLVAAGFERIYRDEVTGTKASRPGWDACLASLRPGDTLIVTKLDGIGRSLISLMDVVTTPAARGVGIRSLDQATSTSPRHTESALPDHGRAGRVGGSHRPPGRSHQPRPGTFAQLRAPIVAAVLGPHNTA